MITSITDLRKVIKRRHYNRHSEGSKSQPTPRQVRLLQPAQTRLTRRVLAAGTIGEVVSYDKLGWLIINFSGVFVRLPADSPMIEVLKREG